MTDVETCGKLLSQYSALTETLTANHCEIPNSHTDDHDHDHSHSHGHEHGHSHGGCGGTHGPYSVWLHVVAIFVVLAASFIGMAIPLAGKYVPCLKLNPFLFIIGKCIATGVVLAVATIHMINHSAHGFEEECIPDSWKESYDAYPFLFAIIAALLIHLLETLLGAILGTSEVPSTPTGAECGEPGNKIVDGKRGDALCGDDECYHVHSHGQPCVATSKAQHVLSALFMVFGVTLHSVFIGITVGIAADASMKALLVALVFHQLFEGLALGARLVDASMRTPLELLLALVFSFSAPIGAAVGVGTVAGSKASVTGGAFVLLQAIFDAACGGILLYLAFVLMLSDFPMDLRKHAGLSEKHCGWKRFAMFAALWAGTGLMAGIGKWL